jgi:hypothetical protein
VRTMAVLLDWCLMARWSAVESHLSVMTPKPRRPQRPGLYVDSQTCSLPAGTPFICAIARLSEEARIPPLEPCGDDPSAEFYVQRS